MSDACCGPRDPARRRRTPCAADSSPARIAHVVEQAQERKGVGQRLADRGAKPLVPAITVLVAASPCAL
ncbi:hypothetical protein, partial [Actinosynnema sp.]|uniref:hypothetical protein n=1 Tax=Actinosynnema sp. TaxID=1872144 RepID=UPI003F876AFC